MLLTIKPLHYPENNEERKKRPPSSVSTLRSRIVDYRLSDNSFHKARRRKAGNITTYG